MEGENLLIRRCLRAQPGGGKIGALANRWTCRGRTLGTATVCLAAMEGNLLPFPSGTGRRADSPFSASVSAMSGALLGDTTHGNGVSRLRSKVNIVFYNDAREALIKAIAE